MSTRSLTLDEAMRELVTQTRKHLIGQDAAVTAFAAEICRHIALSPLQRRPGIFLVAGPNVDDDHLGLPLGLAATFSKTGGRYELASSQGEDLAHVFALSPQRNGSLLSAAIGEGQSHRLVRIAGYRQGPSQTFSRPS